MPSCKTTQWVSTAPYVILTVTERSSANTATTTTFDWSLQYVASSAANTSVAKSYSVVIAGDTVKSGTYNIDGKTGTNTIASGTKVVNKTTSVQTIKFSVSFGFNLTWSNVYKGTLTASGSVSVSAITKYTISYNANGGSGASSSQTKWHGTTLVLSSTKPTRAGYTFRGWATSSSATTVTYSPGSNYTANATVTLYAVWKALTYTVTYNANGGSGAPSAQTKTHGVNLTLSTTKPIRTNYTFKGWGTSASATTVSYASGATYKNNVAVTLYAIWELSYTAPRIYNTSLYRCDSSGVYTDEGVCVSLSFDWECDTTIDSITIKYKVSGEDEWTTTTDTSSTGTSGTFSWIMGSGSTVFDPERTYLFDLVVTDTNGESHNIVTLNGAVFDIDVIDGCGGIAFGKPAEVKGLCDIGYKTRFFGGIEHVVLEPETDLNDIVTPNTYIGANISNNNYLNCPLTSGTFTLSVEGAGEEGQVVQILTRCSKNEPERYIRYYYQSAWGEWMPDAYNTIYVKETGTDLNNYEFSGVYYFSSAYVPTNIPVGTNGWLWVLRADAGAIKQIWMRYGTALTNDHNMYVRTGNATTWGGWTRYAIHPDVLYTGSHYSSITLAKSAANYEYIEIIYQDNNDKAGGVAKIYSPNGKTVCLSIVEAGADGNTYIRRTNWTISGTSMTADVDNAGYVRFNAANAVTNVMGSSYIKVRSVLGYRA